MCNSGTTTVKRCFSRCSYGLLSLVLIVPMSFVSSALAQQPVWLQQTMSLADARHLAGRTGFGATAQELASLTGLTRAQAVKQITDGLNSKPYVPMPVWVDQPAPRFWTRGAMPPEQQQAFDQERDAEIAELRHWWVNNLLQTDSPQTERLVLFWHDHFATSYDGINRHSISLARQNQLFRESGTGSYRTFLKQMIRDPALLFYLDNQSNRKGRPNENLARELLELFTLGEGNYDEPTVKEAARALTGYGISETRNSTFRFHAYKHDTENKNLFGFTGNHDGDSLIDIILQQPAAARHLVKKFWVAYVADREPDEQFVSALAESFRQSDYNLLHLYTAVLQSEHFWDESNRLSLIKSPATLLVGTARSLDYPKRSWPQMSSLHSLMGMELFAPPNVSGWKEGAAFVSPGRLLNRQLALRTLLESASTEQPRNSESMMSLSGSSAQMMTNSNSMKNPADVEQVVAPLQLRLAGHFFSGAPRYRVSLISADNSQAKTLWMSNERELQVGYDTQMFGEMRSSSMLPWVTQDFYPTENAVNQAAKVKIEFLNDAAGKDGDRNLFVESVTLRSQTFSSAGADQQSHCVPKNRRYAGNLYCEGFVAIDVTSSAPDALERDSAFTATDARVLWTRNMAEKNTASVNADGNRLDAIIGLENVQTPEQFFHTVSFHLYSENSQSLQIRLDNFGCWPDCVDHWPDCAHTNPISDEKSLIFPLRRTADQTLQCHYESLTQSQQHLVNALWKSLTRIVPHVAAHEPRERHIGNLKLWQQRLSQLEHAINQSDYVQTAEIIQINKLYTTPEPEPRKLSEPDISIVSLSDFEERVKDSDLSLADLLIGGADLSGINETDLMSELPFEQQLQQLISHPVYQVY